MARRSQWEHLKSEIEAEFGKGKQPRDLYASYPSVPPRTIRDWHSALYPPNSPSDSPNVEKIDSSRVEVLSPQSNLVAFDGADNTSDFNLARRTLRSIASDRKQIGAVRVQASLGLLRITMMRAEIPKAILEEIEETSVEHERDRIQNESPEEIARRYREALG